jgi:hypothetical protein
MLVPQSEPCSTTLRCSLPTTRALCRKASYGADLPSQNSIQVQAAQAADRSRKKLDDPPLTRPFPFPRILPGHGRFIALRPCHDNGIALSRGTSEPLS